MRSISTALAAFCVTVACGGSPTEPAAALSVTVTTNSIASGTSVQAAVTVSSGPGAGTVPSNVTWSSQNSSIASVSSTGVITGNLKGGTNISATSGGITGKVQVTVGPGAPVSIVIFSGEGQSGNKGTTLLDPLCTNVKDAAGNLIIGAIVTYTVATGGGTIAAPTAPPTDPGGIATSGLWTLGPNAGSQTVSASSPGAGSLMFTATAK
jgi:hypothetical protein